MALYKSKQITNRLPIPSASGANDVVPIFGDFTFPAGTLINDVIEMCPLPAGYVLVDAFADTDDLGGTITVDCGILSGNYGDSGARTCGAEIMNDKAFGTVGIYRADVPGFSRIAPTTNDRSIGFALVADTTPTTDAKVRLTILVRPAIEGA